MNRSAPAQADLFAGEAPPALPSRPALPEGMVYETDFLSPEEEARWIEVAAALGLKEMNYRGYTARRRVASYGGTYDFQAHRLEASDPLPRELEPLRTRVAAWLGVPPEALTQALVAEYREGTPLGWHRDVPDFEDVVGVSLLSEAVMRLRPYPPGDAKTSVVIKLAVQPRSVYLLRGPSRWGWQHSVSPTKALRYSITFRTARRPPGQRGKARAHD